MGISRIASADILERVRLSELRSTDAIEHVHISVSAITKAERVRLERVDNVDVR